MLHSLCNSLLHYRYGFSFGAHSSSVTASLSLIRYLSIDVDNPHSFTVSYLTNYWGLSPKSALSVSKSVHFETPNKPDLILSYFEKLGFSKPQISQMIIKFPRFLSFDPHKIIFPKVDFFHSKIASTPDLVKIFTAYPWILRLSLKNQLIPSWDFLIDLFQSEYKAIEVIKRNPRVLTSSPETAITPNINTLRENGVPASNILWLTDVDWMCIGKNPVNFVKIVEEVKEMGFSPVKMEFVEAIRVLGGMTKLKRDGKVEVCKRWGWSDKDIITAFKKNPRYLFISADKIMAVMDFYVNKMGLESSFIANRLVLLGLSLKKRLIPRGVVIQYLCSKGLVELDSRITNMLECTEKRFFEKYVNCHKKEAPRLIKLYNEKLNEGISEVGRKSSRYG